LSEHHDCSCNIRGCYKALSGSQRESHAVTETAKCQM
jgi:hypothetical protein